MLQNDLINEFLDKKVIAVVGLSRKGDNPANYIFRRFKEVGYKTYAVNPNADEIENDKCYPSIADIPGKVEAVFFGGTPKVTEQIIEQCARIGISIIWMHRGIGKGSYSEKAEDLARQYGIASITNGCPLMFLGNVDPFHRVLKWLKR